MLPQLAAGWERGRCCYADMLMSPAEQEYSGVTALLQVGGQQEMPLHSVSPFDVSLLLVK